jgi:hypothetical protein
MTISCPSLSSEQKRYSLQITFLNHITHPTTARPRSAGGKLGKKQQPSLEPCLLFGEKGKDYCFFGGGFPGYSTMLTTEKVSLRFGELLGCG